MNTLDSAMKKRSVTIVIPVHNEQDNIQPLTSRIQAALQQTSGWKAHLLFVDDGSTDNTVGVLEGLRGKGIPVGYLKLSRNFGHQVDVEIQNCLIPHLRQEGREYTIFPDAPDAEYVLVFRGADPWPMTQEKFDERVDELLADPSIEVVAENGGCLLLKRTHALRRSANAFSDR